MTMAKVIRFQKGAEIADEKLTTLSLFFGTA
jgi:hypothetical protein